MAHLRRFILLTVSAMAVLCMTTAPPMAPTAGTPIAPAARTPSLLPRHGPDAVRLIRALDGTSLVLTEREATLTTGPVPPTGGLHIQRTGTGTGTYAVPQRLASVFGTRLDTGLFDVESLAAAPRSGLPVTIAYADSAAPTPVPGVVVTRRAGTTGAGVVTDASKSALGRALARTPATLLFAGVASVRPTVLPRRTAGRPARWPMHTLVIRAINAQGGPLDGARDGAYGYLVNVDDPARFGSWVFFYRGEARVSVPAGTYSLDVLTGNRLQRNESRLLFALETRVCGPTTMTIDARAARIPARFEADEPTYQDLVAVAFGRFDAARTGGSSGLASGGSGWRLLVTPTRPVRTGVAAFLAFGLLHPIRAATEWYSLVRDLGGRLVAPVGDHVVRDDLASIPQERYHRGVVDGFLVRTFYLPEFAASFGVSDAPRFTELVTANVASLESAVTGVDRSTGTFADTYLAGRAIEPTGPAPVRRWGRAPMGPVLSEDALVPPVICPACVSGTVLTVLAGAFGDADGHLGLPSPFSSESSAWEVSADGVTLGTGAGEPAAVFDLWPGTSRVAVTITTGGTPSGSGPASSTSTRWDAPLGSATDPAPGDWWCQTGGEPCRTLPLLRPEFDVPVGLDTVVRGRQALMRLTRVDRSRPPQITAATLDVSYDDAATWAAASLAADGTGAYAVTLPPAPTPGLWPVALRVHAVDARSGTLDQTITRAFDLAS